MLPSEVGRDSRAIGLQTMPRLWICIDALNDRNRSQIDCYAFFRARYRVGQPHAHIKASGDRLALSTLID